MSALVATLLRSSGFDVTNVPEQANLGKTDKEQLEFASSLDRCLITHNRVDFEKLHLQYITDKKTTFWDYYCSSKKCLRISSTD